MANVTRIEGKKGISYKLTAYCGYNSDGSQIKKFKTWRPDRPMTDRQAVKEATYQAELFEDAINKGIMLYDGKVKFAEYAEKWLENAQIAPKTHETYRFLLVRINQAIGHMRLDSIQPHHLQSFYKNLAECGVKGKGRYIATSALNSILKSRKISRDGLADLSGISLATASCVRNGQRISTETAEKIAASMDIPISKIFELHESVEGLSDKSVLHHHRVITAILNSAKKERIIPHNVASEFMDAPKVKHKEAKYLDDLEARKLVDILLVEPDIRVKTAMMLMLYGGFRRGEACGLEWPDIDDKNNVIHVMRASQYQMGAGISTVPPKNESSKRPIKMPPIIFDVLAQYRIWWTEQKLLNGSKWRGDTNRLFIQWDGKPLNPDTMNFWFDRFIERHGLERFTPHTLRHTFTSLQINAGVNITALQRRTGHAQASTLTNIYAHAFKTAEEAATEALDSILTPGKSIKQAK